MKLTYLIGLGAIAALSACSAPPPPPPIQGELILNKFGEPEGCEEGVYIPGAAYQEQCLPPRDDCDPNATAATTAYNPCYPPGQPGDDNTGRIPRVPGNQTTVPRNP